MSVTSTTSRVSYTGNGATATYAYTFEIHDDDDLLVTVRDTASPSVETTLTKTTDYTVTGVGLTAGGNVVLVNASQTWLTSGFLTSGYLLVIRRKPALLQSEDFKNQGDYYPERHEETFDHILMQLQSLRDELDRSIRAPECDATILTRIVAAADRASKYLGFDVSGQPAVLAAPAGTSTVSAYGATLIDDATASDAQTTLGLSAFIKTLIDDADAATARTTLGGTAGVWPATLGGTGLSALGTAYQQYRVNAAASAVEWANPATWPTAAKTTTYTLTMNDAVILATAASAWTLTVPAAAAGNAGKIFIVRKTDANFNAITLATGISTTLNTQGETVVIQSDGAAWNVVQRIVPSVWTAYTPAFAWSTGSGTGFWRRVGDSIECQVRFACTSAPTGSFTASIPNQSTWTIDTAKLTSTTTGEQALGQGMAADTGTANYPITAWYNNTTTVLAMAHNASGTYALGNTVSATVPITFGNTDTVQCRFTVPITGLNGL